MVDYIVGGVLLLIVGAVVLYLVRAKRRGERCIGCPHAKACKRGSCCDKASEEKEEHTS